MAEPPLIRPARADECESLFVFDLLARSAPS